MTNEELNEAIRYLEEERLTVEAILYGENQDKFDNTIMLIDDAKFRLSRKPLTIYDMAIKALEQTRWISVSERLPKDGQKVLVTTRSGNIIDVDTSIFYHASAFWKHYVIAWMPLPPSYQGEENG